MSYVNVLNNRAMVKIDGFFRASVAVVINAKLEKALRDGCQKVIFDFTSTTFIDSPSLKVVLKTFENVGYDNVSIINVQRNGKIHKSFIRYQLENYITSFI